MKSILISLLIFAFSFFIFGTKIVSAEDTNAPSAGDFTSWTNTATPKFAGEKIGYIISTILPYIFGLVGFLLLYYIVLGGYQVLISRGDPKQMAAGKDKITWSVVGFVVLFSAYWIIQLVGRILGIEQITNIFG